MQRKAFLHTVKVAEINPATLEVKIVSTEEVKTSDSAETIKRQYQRKNKESLVLVETKEVLYKMADEFFFAHATVEEPKEAVNEG